MSALRLPRSRLIGDKVVIQDFDLSDDSSIFCDEEGEIIYWVDSSGVLRDGVTDAALGDFHTARGGDTWNFFQDVGKESTLKHTGTFTDPDNLLREEFEVVCKLVAGTL